MDTQRAQDIQNMLVEAHVLVIDDSKLLRMGISRSLQQLGITKIDQAENGHMGLDKMRSQTYDLILLDVEMPQMTGLEVLSHMQQDTQLKGLPVIVISGGQDIDDVVKCIEMGAEDYLPKPFSLVLLRARLCTSIEKKRLRDLDKQRLKQLQEQHQLLEQEQAKTEAVLLNILPQAISNRIKKGETLIADAHAEATVLFADLVGFTKMSHGISAEELVEMLNEIISSFDVIVRDEGVEKIKTIGDCYMLVGGVPDQRSDHACAVARCGIHMLEALKAFNQKHGTQLQVRVGMHTGPVVAGVIGLHKYTFDLWGDTVNVASRMESTGVPDHIQISSATAEKLKDHFHLELRGNVAVKGIGEVSTYFIKTS